MIRPMLDRSFIPYGRIAQGERPESFETIPLYGGGSVALYRFDRDTSWDFSSGMTVLYIQTEDGINLFYLDRYVTLYAGTVFGFFPLSDSSAIWGDTNLLSNEYKTGDAEAPAENLQTPSPKIYTMFRQVGRGGLYFRGETHQPYELVYLEKGILYNYCGGQNLVMRPKEFMIFGSNSWHMQYAEEDVVFLTVSFSWEGHDFSPFSNQILPASAEMQRAVLSLLREYEQELLGKNEYINAELMLLLLQILRTAKALNEKRKRSPATVSAHGKIVDQAMQHVSTHIYEKLTVSKLASAVNVSSSQLTSLFNAYLGVSPAKYITRIRLEESKMLLSQKQMSVAEIASKLGYSSIQHFSKQFRDSMGCTPTAFAKSAAE